MERDAVLAAVHDEVAACRRCERLVAWREQVAHEKRAAFRDQTYWGRGVPGFGDPAARIVVLGLAPAAHGANRTGRVFTGDRSGDWLYRAMHRAGLANQPTSVSIDDGLELRGAWVTAAVKCAPPANAPTPAERDACAPFLARELAALEPRVVVCLGEFGYRAACSHYDLRRRPRFAHLLEVPIDPSAGVRPSAAGAHGGPADTRMDASTRVTLVCSYHPSQQNTFTGRLTEAMLDAVFARAVQLASDRSSPSG
ncbi:MAG: uracil-DNA glycosylase [Ilumatobacteraceae bacterium]|nr:uracil-DNA glycosylase [Ilumatobacteraceae bacterium]